MKVISTSTRAALCVALACSLAARSGHAQEASTSPEESSPAVAQPDPLGDADASSPVPGLGREEMERAMVGYFRGERLGGVGFSSVGLSSLVAGGLMLRSSADFYQGMSYPLLALGGIQLLVGGAVLYTPTPRMRRFRKQIGADPAGYRTGESKRIRGVKLTFKILVIAELAMAAAGAGMAIYGARADKDLIAGIGVGLSVEAALLLLQDSLASRRASRYLDALTDFRVALAPQQKSYWLSYGRTF